MPPEEEKATYFINWKKIGKTFDLDSEFNLTLNELKGSK